MSKTTNMTQKYRRRLLGTASALAIASVCAPSAAYAADADRPLLWIEGDLHFDKVTGTNESFVPPLDSITTNGFPDVPTAANFLGQGSGGFPSFTDIENVRGRSFGLEGSISFQPEDSNWVFNISARYGRTHSRKHVLAQENIVGPQTFATGIFPGGFGYHLTTPSYVNYVDQAAENAEAHTIVDFKAGRDVGLGLLGKSTESVFSLGARYARMSTTSKGHSYAEPGERFYHLKTAFFGKYYAAGEHQNSASVLHRHSSFQGLGPLLSWSNTTGLWGEVEDGQIALEWGANAAVLFGRQKVKNHHDSVVHKSRDSMHANLLNGSTFRTFIPLSSTSNSVNRTETRRVTVPNLGGFAALTYRFTNAKLSVGYRSDFFFGALDGGLDARHDINTGFSGPYASISIGLGD